MFRVIAVITQTFGGKARGCCNKNLRIDAEPWAEFTQLTNLPHKFNADALMLQSLPPLLNVQVYLKPETHIGWGTNS